MSFDAALFIVVALLSISSLCLGVLLGVLIVIGFFPHQRKSRLD